MAWGKRGRQRSRENARKESHHGDHHHHLLLLLLQALGLKLPLNPAGANDGRVEPLKTA